MMLVEVHMLKNFAPSNLNRDDTGSAKSCVFGGITRGRISSQCIKRNIRKSKLFNASFDESLFGIRTRKLPQKVAEELEKRGLSENWLKAVTKKVTGFGNRDGKENDDQITAQIMFISPAEIKIAADCIEKIIEESKDVKTFEKIKPKDIQLKMKKEGFNPITLDIALFGRMVTSDAFRDIEASLQMAHAISTNRLEREFDYYTAVDDLVTNEEEDDTGAGMIGDTEFNSNCYYMYYNVDLEQLKRNLDGIENISNLVQKTGTAFLHAFAYTNPSGKQNSFAAHQLPAVIYVEIKKDKIPVNYANAFLNPAKPSREKDLVHDSAEKLINHINVIQEHFNDIEVVKRIWFAAKENLDTPKNAEKVGNMKELLTAFEGAIKEVC
jgi:CRISPR system Cascade subunit CasC